MSVKLKVIGNLIHYNEHYLLNGLDRADQHPISAIIGLEDALTDKYEKPNGGIPDSDLKEKYIKFVDYNKDVESIREAYAANEKHIRTLNDSLNESEKKIETNKDNIADLLQQYQIIKDMIDSDSGFNGNIINGSSYIEQKVFNVIDDNKSIIIEIVDTNLKVIEPTILKSDNTLALINIDYTLSYVDNTHLKIDFVNNGEYKINYLSGSLTETEFSILLNSLNKFKKEMNSILSDSGAYVNPVYNKTIEYDDYGRLYKEIYTGDVNKTIEYSYDCNDNIISKKVIQDNVIKIATYRYDDNGQIISINDNGTNIPVDGTAGLRYSLKIKYNERNLISTETYTGDINKIVSYSYNEYDNVILKTIVENNITKNVRYIYDEDRHLIEIQDEGSERIGVAFKNIIENSNSSNCSCDSENCAYNISEEQLELIFSTIFKE